MIHQGGEAGVLPSIVSFLASINMATYAAEEQARPIRTA